MDDCKKMHKSLRSRKKNKSKFRETNSRRESSNASSEFSWIPEFFGPVFKNEKISLRQALQTHLIDRKTKMMATFVPDELIYALDLTKKNFREFIAVILLIDVSALNRLWESFSCAENYGSNGFHSILNSYTSIIIENIYFCEGDIIKISAQGIMAMWKVMREEFIAKTIAIVVECALHLQTVMENFGDGFQSLTKVKMAISTGVVTFSVIGNAQQRDFVIVGEPVREVRMAKQICVPGDVLLTESAWCHVSSEHYEYVFRDAYNVKIIGLKEFSRKSYEKLKRNFVSSDPLSHPSQKNTATNLKIGKQELFKRISNISTINTSIEESELERKIFTGRFSMAEATRRNLGSQLKSFSKNPVFQQIEKHLPMDHLTETRRVTIVNIKLEPMNTSVYELITLIDQTYVLLHSIVSNHSGSLNAVNVYPKDINFFLVFGLLGFATSSDDSKNGILCATESVTALKSVSGIRGVSIGISTGMVYCGVIGHTERMEYVILGPPIEKAIAIMNISNNKISCEFDTLFYSQFSLNKFRSRGMKDLKGFGRSHLYEFIEGKSIKNEENSSDVANLEYVYPILGRFQELDMFTDILDDICASNRTYCGFLIEGSTRIGKSRLLDEAVKIAKFRQITVHKLALHQSDTSKPYATVHRLLMNLFDATDCKTIEKRERIVTTKLSKIIPWKDFCYLNIVMRLKFALSDNYYLESEEERFAKSLTIFDAILKSLQSPHCIFLDDVQFMDFLSWKFISRTMKNSKFVLVMTIQRNPSYTKNSESITSIINDKRIFRCELTTLDSRYTSPLICQFLNVKAIHRKLDNMFKTNGNHPGWCEAFLALLHQKEALDFPSLKPDEIFGKNFIIPNFESVSKIPKDLSPEETTDVRLSCDEGNIIVCLTNENFCEDIESVLDIKGIYQEIYERSTPYEQTLLQCAAAISNVFNFFTRSMLQNVLTNSSALYTTYAVSRLIGMRILECASNQRKNFQNDEINLCTHTKRSTFSDMHHFLQCSCRFPDVKSMGKLPRYSQCKFLEFKAKEFKDFIYAQITAEQKKLFHTKAMEIYERDARKCKACGGGSFIRIHGKEKPITIESTKIPKNRQRISIDGSPIFKPKRRSFLSISSDELKIQHSEMEIRRISIMPSYFESDEESMSSSDAIKMVTSIRKSSGIIDDDESMKFGKRASIYDLETVNDPSRLSHLKNFNHIDFRNCQCNEIVDCLFLKIYQHLRIIGHSEKFVRFMMNYNAGLIQTGQPFQAMILLNEIYENNESSNIDLRLSEIKLEDRKINRGAILALMGDASMDLGNLDKAKKYYMEAVRINVEVNYASNKICVPYRIFDEACKQKLCQRYPKFFINRITGSDVTTKLSAASYLARLSLILSKEGQIATCQLAALKSFNNAFSCSGSFLEKSDLYLKISKIFRDINNLSYARRFEKPMIYTIKNKQWWSDAEEITTVALVFKTIFEIRLLRGEYENAFLMGIKVLKISGALKICRIKLIILPQLIQLTIRTKRIHETVDLLKELYHSSLEDIDESSMTWYYALCLDIALDAGMLLETFETCVEYAKKITGSKYAACVSRDPDSLRRLLTCLWIWQLRMGASVPENFVEITKFETKEIRADNFCHVTTMAKTLECYILILGRCINLKQANYLAPLLDEIESIVNFLEGISKMILFIKPRLYMLKAYLEITHGRKISAMRYLKKGSKFAVHQRNILMVAWIRQNERTWTMKQFNNMARYWVEHVGCNLDCDWHNIDCFDINSWSSTLYPIPVADTSL